MLGPTVNFTCHTCGTAFHNPMSVWALVQMTWFSLLARFAQRRRLVVIALCKDCEDLARRRYDFVKAHGRFD